MEEVGVLSKTGHSSVHSSDRTIPAGKYRLLYRFHKAKVESRVGRCQMYFRVSLKEEVQDGCKPHNCGTSSPVRNPGRRQSVRRQWRDAASPMTSSLAEGEIYLLGAQ